MCTPARATFGPLASLCGRFSLLPENNRTRRPLRRRWDLKTGKGGNLDISGGGEPFQPRRRRSSLALLGSTVQLPQGGWGPAGGMLGPGSEQQAFPKRDRALPAEEKPWLQTSRPQLVTLSAYRLWKYTSYWRKKNFFITNMSNQNLDNEVELVDVFWEIIDKCLRIQRATVCI